MPTPTFSQLTDLQLVNAQLALSLACGRSHQSLAHRRQEWFCFLFKVFDLERQARGLPVPAPQTHAGDLKPPDFAI